ncbi:type III secretion system inner rod subunit SctI [Glaciimonas immobilis]|uniref:Type III secretion system protein PrgJ n=1 Tax=Glaciimonas immobilis TaxID=728004 RepID=A0A840RQD8_9BURK|nr:type III secretion system inner rod subunit SctI [Glaciimonas immobilis]KAF3999347.1 type III secretion system inner rod subunit SctI [Glaciimonas immobilis]MBB5198830.1 hypothetical protein [Glaciimonas immobilis]
MTINAIANIERASSAKFSDISPNEMSSISLDDRLRDAFASSSVATQNEYQYFMSAVTNAKNITSPGALFELQVRLGDYKQEVEVISALTRKAVSTVETLLRA